MTRPEPIVAPACLEKVYDTLTTPLTTVFALVISVFGMVWTGGGAR